MGTTWSDEEIAFEALLSALADPKRQQIVDALHAAHTLTTGELSKLFPEMRSSLRWHIKRLVDVGAITAVSGEGRETVWEVTLSPVTWSQELLADERFAVVSTEMERVLTDRRLRRVREWLIRRDGWSVEWKDAAVGRDYVMHLTQDELGRLEADIQAAVVRARELAIKRHEDDGPGDEVPVFLTVNAVPFRPGD